MTTNDSDETLPKILAGSEEEFDPELLARLELADGFMESGKVDAAVKVIEADVQRWPDVAGLWHNLGLARESRNDYDAAISAYSRAIELGYDSRINRGLLLEQLDDFAGAADDYAAVLKADSNDVDALVNLGTLELTRQNTARATELLERAATLDPSVSWQLADAYRATDRVDDARRALDTAIAAGETRAFLDRADLNGTDGLTPRAESDYRAAVDAHVRWARREYAIALDLGGRPHEAIQVAEQGVQLGDELCCAPLAVILESLGRLEEALHYYRRAVAAGDTNYQEDVDALEMQLPPA